MGKDLYDNFKKAREVFDRAGDEIKDWCFNGTKEMLRQTNVTQPSIYTVTMAAYGALLEEAERTLGSAEALEINGYAGFSLGEYSALTAAGVISDVEHGLSLVRKRGRFMDEAGRDRDGNQRGGMSAAFGRREAILDVVEKARKGRILEAANFNSPMQTVVAGEYAALDDFTELAKSNRLKVKRLSVSSAFHSPLMRPAADKLREMLLAEDLHEPDGRIYANVTGRDMMEDYDRHAGKFSEYVSDIMARQTMTPVRWQETIENIIADGAEVIIEVGPGKTLTGIVRKITDKATILNVDDRESLEETVDFLSR